jgi:hypothetical protein
MRKPATDVLGGGFSTQWKGGNAFKEVFLLSD